MRSLWRDRAAIETDSWDDVDLDRSFDDIVVGGGLTGLVTALLLARAGREVVLLEARELGAVTTGNTTGKLSLLQGTTLSGMLAKNAVEVTQAYVEANLEGQQWLLRFCEDHSVGYQVRDAVTFAANSGPGLRQARSEHDAATKLGLPVRWEDQFPVPFPHSGGTLLPGQAQLDAMDLLEALSAAARVEGALVLTGRRVVGASKTGPPTVVVRDERGSEAHVRGATVVLATGTPILDRGLYFAKVEALRSYALAFDHPEPTELMMMAAGTPSRSIRDAPSSSGTQRRLLIGGEGHGVGRTSSEAEHLDRLREWTVQHYPGAVETHAWSAQDYVSHDSVPFVGPMPRGGGNIYLATGYHKWGMTNAPAAALNITAQILGSEPSWARPLHRRVTGPRAAASLVRMNAAVGAALAAGAAAAATRSVTTRVPAEGEAAAGHQGVVPVGRSTVGGNTCSVVALCTHLGGVLRWNDAESSWDCPLHGSRFAADGSVLEGPATRALRPGPAPSAG